MQTSGNTGRFTKGRALTVTALVVEEHPVLVSVNVSVAVPDPMPVTTPPFVTVATPVLLLDQVPPVVGNTDVLPPMQMMDPALKPTLGPGIRLTK
jgi:hypothetical protein